MSYPRFMLVRQHFSRPRLGHGPAGVAAAIEAATAEQLAAAGLIDAIRLGDTVAITAGSRGIAHMPLILRAAAQAIRAAGGQPFLVPAMGSHGGGTAEGQMQVLANLGITPESIGCEIRSSMTTQVLGELSPEAVCAEMATGPDAQFAPSLSVPVPVHFDETALAATHSLVINRIKPHTHFHGPVQSGLIKMLVIGLGKHEGAKVMHRAAIDCGWERVAKASAGLVLQKANCRAGLAIIENGFDETAKIIGLAAGDFLASEPALLDEAETLLARLPFADADLLIVDEMGKNISGAGMDTVVIGRKPGGQNLAPQLKRIWVRRLTAETHGNATGLGSADYCSPQLLQQIDHEVTRINCTTGGNPRAGMIPLSYATEQATAVAALSTIGLCPPDQCRAMWIRSTRQLEVVACSEAYSEELAGRGDLEMIAGPLPLAFDRQGNVAGALPQMMEEKLRAAAG